MALTVVADLTFSADKVILTDNTGDYNVTTNPTGYGTPNAAFADYAHYAIIRKKNVNSVADEVLTLDAYNPITDTVFEADRETDGWYEGVKLNIPIWDAGDTYTGGSLTTGGVVYYSGSVYYCVTTTSAGESPGTHPAKWTAVSDLTTIEDNPTIVVTIDGRTTAYDADVYWSQQIATLSQQGQCGVPFEDNKLKDRLDKIYRYIQNVLVADQLGNNTDGEWCVLQLRALGAKASA